MTARSTINEASLEAWIRREFTARARRALTLYRSIPLISDEPSYPFDTHPGDGSIRSVSSSTIRSIPGGVRITVQSRGAPFFEGGNDLHGATINKPMALPLKRAAGKRGARFSKAAQKAGGRRGSVVVDPATGRAYLMVQRVRTYRGRHALEASVRTAFGIAARGA